MLVCEESRAWRALEGLQDSAGGGGRDVRPDPPERASLSFCSPRTDRERQQTAIGAYAPKAVHSARPNAAAVATMHANARASSRNVCAR